MLRNRLDGLVSLHAIWTSILVAVGFFVFTLGTDATEWIRLTEGFNRNLYFLAVFLGMAISGRVYLGWTEKLTRLSWLDSVYITAHQVARLALVLFGMAFVMKDTDVSRVFLAVFMANAGVLLVVANKVFPRLIARVVFRSSAIPTLVIGSPQGDASVARWLKEQASLGVEILGFVTKDGTVSGGNSLGRIDDLPRILANNPASQIILPLFYLSSEESRRVMAAAREAGCRVRIVEDLKEGLERPFAVERTDDGLAVMSIDEEPLQNPLNRVIKRIFDIAVALPVVLFVLPPLAFVVALMQRSQAPGPILFRQIRYGADRRTFLILKFRTMYAASQSAATEAVQAKKGDSRIYPFGAFLRKTSLDEFPQFLNVLFGDMSVSGPRPHLVQHDDQFARFVLDYRMRHFVKPGITGLAQCNGFRGEITEMSLLEKRVENDIDYVRTWTPALDVAILFRTARQVLFPPKSAY